jgi:hypothetical protein
MDDFFSFVLCMALGSIAINVFNMQQSIEKIEKIYKIEQERKQ